MNVYVSNRKNLHRRTGPAVDTPFLKQYWFEGKLHRPDGPAVISNLGTEQYYWKGVNVPKAKFLSVLDGTVKVDDILTDSNAEMRRIYVEMYGWERLIKDAKAKELDADLTTGAVLYRIELPEIKREGTRGEGFKDEPIVIVRVIDSTPVNGINKKYFLRVPPDIKTCKEAIAWTFEMKPEDYTPEKET